MDLRLFFYCILVNSFSFFFFRYFSRALSSLLLNSRAGLSLDFLLYLKLFLILVFDSMSYLLVGLSKFYGFFYVFLKALSYYIIFFLFCVLNFPQKSYSIIAGRSAFLFTVFFSAISRLLFIFYALVLQVLRFIFLFFFKILTSKIF